MLKSSSLCLYSSNLGIFWLKIEQFWPFEEIFLYFQNYLEIDVKFIAKMCSISRSTYPAILK
jgi:hypothetical protein